MKRLTLILGTLCLGFSLSAQSGIIKTRPANDPAGKILTMEETTLSRELSPSNIYASWENAGTILLHKDGKWQAYDIATGGCSDYKRKEKLSMQTRTENGNLYVIYANGTERLIAERENDQITYGQYVSRNEFGIDGGTFWAPDNSKLAFYRKDESKVTSFPLLDITTRTGSLREIKYPMAGMDSENVQLGIYDVASGRTVYADVDEFGYDQYLTNISWRPDGSQVLIQVLDRSQKHMKLNVYDAATGDFVKTILTEDNEKYVNEMLERLGIDYFDKFFIHNINYD